MAGSLVDLSQTDDSGGGSVIDLSTAGAIPEHPGAPLTTDTAAAPPHADAVNTALTTVKTALDYGRQKYGLSKGDSPEPGNYAPYAGMRQSPNIEDRRDAVGAPTMGDTSRTKLDDVVDRAREFRSGFNPMSQELGINDVGSARGAIPDEEEANNG